MYATTTLLESKEIASWIGVNDAAATIVVITDGFNTEKEAETCSANVRRLQYALETIQKARHGEATIPTLHMVGLGQAIRPKWKLPRGGNVTEMELCGEFADQQISGNLEELGIDNASLMWLADAGGGDSFIKNNHKGLADVFLTAAAQRYKWYTARYGIDSFYQRRSFDTRLRLQTFAKAQTIVWFRPSSWIDAPTPTLVPGSRWATAPAPFARTLVPVLTIFGALLFIRFLGPASQNARRAIFRRVRRK
jgi:hypothetical protein